MKFQNHFGLDIGGSSMKAVQLSQQGDKFKLVAFGEAPCPQFENAAERPARFAEAIKKLHKDAKINTKQVVISLQESQVYTRVVEMPFLEEPELTTAIKWQAEQYIPVPLTDVVLKHQMISLPEVGTPNAKMEVLLIAAPNALVNDYLFFLGKAGLEVIGIETETFAAIRSLIESTETSPTTLLVDMGSMETTASIITNGNLSLTQSITTGGTSLTRALSTGLGLETNQAEEYKKSYGFDSQKLEGKVGVTVKPIVDIILNEVKRSIAFYMSHGQVEPIKRVVLCGGGALLPGIVPYFTENLGLEVQIGDPFAHISSTDDQKKAIGELGTIYSVAVGLAQKKT